MEMRIIWPNAKHFPADLLKEDQTCAKNQMISRFRLKVKKLNFLPTLNRAIFMPSESFQSVVRNRTEGNAFLISGGGLLTYPNSQSFSEKHCFHFSLLRELGAKGFPEAKPVMPPRDSKPSSLWWQNPDIQQAQLADVNYEALSAFVGVLD